MAMQPPQPSSLPSPPPGDAKLSLVDAFPCFPALPAAPPPLPLFFHSPPLSPSSPGPFDVHCASPCLTSPLSLPSAPLLHCASSHALNDPHKPHSPPSHHRRSKRSSDAFTFASTLPLPSSPYTSTLADPPSPTSAACPLSPTVSTSTSLSTDDDLSLPSSHCLGSACVSAPPDRTSSAGSTRRGTLFLSHRRIERAGSIDAPQPLAQSGVTIWQTQIAAQRKCDGGSDSALPCGVDDTSEGRKSRRSLTRFRSSSLQQFAHLFPSTTTPLPLPPPPAQPLERSATFAHSSSSLPCSRRPSYYDAFECVGVATPLSARSRALRRAPRRINWEEIRGRLGGEERHLTEVKWLSCEDRAYSAMPALASAGEEQRDDGCGGRAPSLSHGEWTADARSALASGDCADLRWTSTTISAWAPDDVPYVSLTHPAEVSKAASAPQPSRLMELPLPPPRLLASISAASPAPRGSRPLPSRPPSLPRVPHSLERDHSRERSGRVSASSEVVALLSGKVEQMQRFRGGLRGSLSGLSPTLCSNPAQTEPVAFSGCAGSAMETHSEEAECEMTALQPSHRVEVSSAKSSTEVKR